MAVNILIGMGLAFGGLALVATGLLVALFALRIWEYWLTLKQREQDVARSAMHALVGTPDEDLQKQAAQLYVPNAQREAYMQAIMKARVAGTMPGGTS